MIQVCTNFDEARVFIVNTRPDTIVFEGLATAWYNLHGVLGFSV
jgi:hypothetical protein